MLNTIHLIGRLGADPEMRETPNGYKYARFSLPLFHGFNNQEAKTSWVQCEAWNKLGEIVMTQKKGSQVYIEGELVIDSWESRNDKTGEMERRNRTYIRVRGIRFLDRQSPSATPVVSASSVGPQSQNSAESASVPTAPLHTDADLPELSMPGDDSIGGEGSIQDLFGGFSFTDEE